MIDDAYKGDFDAVKFQKRTIDLYMIKNFLILIVRVHGVQRKENKKMV